MVLATDVHTIAAYCLPPMTNDIGLSTESRESPWNKVQPEAVRKFFKRAELVSDQENDFELRSSSLTREAETEGVDFEHFAATDDEVGTSTEPDPQTIFQTIVAEAGMSLEGSTARDDAEEGSDNETEIIQKLKEEDVGRIIVQLKCFAL
ncbi:hypothetical protein TTRE_0000660501 [Trichuris trichiura]|uniref:Uncharacterized protein n=1 Tax=Trichuris trichiura TaxID=36087 RepID=A0A077ZFI8_TRITR|nr:hypothetical protein TTRE_0000660501 [Trichuris trichiura]